MITRRTMVTTAGAVGAGYLLGRATGASAQTPPAAPKAAGSGPFILPKLPYGYGALEPHIDAMTMQLHHQKHHQAYIDKLNEAVVSGVKILGQGNEEKAGDVDSLLLRMPLIEEPLRNEVKNNGGGHANHSMFWTIMAPATGQKPQGRVLDAFNKHFGSAEQLTTAFEAAGEKHFGAGWVFVTVDAATGELAIATKSNQDSPLMDGKRVLFGNDLWEHAFYLTYNNRKPDYLKNWWNIVNWAEIDRRYNAILTGERVI